MKNNKSKGIFSDALSIFKMPDAPLYASPKSLQEAIEIKNVFPDGVFELNGNKWSKCYIFEDVNYATCDEEDQETVFVQYCKFLNSMEVNYKITINNKYRDGEKFRREVLIEEKGDYLDSFRKDMNSVIEEKLRAGTQGIEQERYLTVTVERRNYEEAKAYFRTLEMNIVSAFKQMGSGLYALDGNERMHILYDFYHTGREKEGCFSENENIDFLASSDFRNDLCNGALKFNKDFIEDDKKVARVLFIKKYPNSLSDRFIMEIMSLPEHIICSIDVVPIPRDVTLKVLNKKQMGIDSDINKQQKIRNKNGDFASDISYTKRKEKEEIEEVMNDIRGNDKKMSYVGVTFLITAKNISELNALTDTIVTIGKRNSCEIEKHYYLQREAMNTALPIGVRQVKTLRTLLTDSLAVLMPFNVQELCMKKGMFLGTHQISRNILLGNRKKLINGNGFVFGVPGSGKSFFCKTEMANVLLTTEDDVIVIDPMDEYLEMADTMQGESVTISNASHNYINPLDIDLENLDVKDQNGLIRDKGEFMLGLCEQFSGEELSARDKSIIDRCVRELYTSIAKKPVAERQQPIMSDFCEILKKQPEKEAAFFSVTMELFTDGSLDLFNHQTNVDVKNRFTVYGIRDLGQGVAPAAMLIIMESISRKILENAKKGKATWLYIDEVHVLLDSEYSAKYLFSLWKKVRKQGGLCTGITQNVVDLLKNYTVVTLLANSEFIVLLKQSGTDAKKLSETLGISKTLLNFVTDSESGNGLLKHGKSIVPFDLTVNKDSRLYKMFNTNLHEKREV